MFTEILLILNFENIALEFDSFEDYNGIKVFVDIN